MKVYVIEAHDGLRAALCGALAAAPGMRVVGSGGSVEQAVDEVPRCAPDVAVIGDGLPDGDLLAACWHLSRAWPRLRVLLHLTVVDSAGALTAELVGASGYILKQIRTTHLVAAARRAFQDRLADQRREREQLMTHVQAVREQAQATRERSREITLASRRARLAAARARARRRERAERTARAC